MADQVKKGVILEFDFTVIDGARLLFDTAVTFMKELDGISFDRRTEAQYLVGRELEDGLRDFFAAVKTKKTPQKAARDLATAFKKALDAAVPTAITPGFKNFVKALLDRDVTLVVTTRAEPELVKQAFAGLGDEEHIVIYPETSTCYGTPRGDSWRRACIDTHIRYQSAIAVTGSSAGVKAALMSGMGSIAVPHDHVAYQDFGGADAEIADFNAAAAKRAIALLRL